jgi:serine phosphatase RsbU (regulator of sigma subunit)
MAVLVRTRGTHNGQWVHPLADRCLLGRHSDCDLAFLFADVTGVSRHHALIERAGNQYFIEDRGSKNGTLLNGTRLTARWPLSSGDRISICDVELTFYEDRAPTPAETDESVTLEEDAQAQAMASVPVAPAAPPAQLAGYTAEKLRALAHMLRRLGSSLDTDATLHELLSGLFAIFRQADRGFVAFSGAPQERVRPRATLFRRPQDEPRLAISHTFIDHVLARREAVLWAAQGKLADLPSTSSMQDLEIRCVMCAPLLDSEGHPFGVVQIDSDDGELGFTLDDLEVMAGAVNQAAVAVRYTQLHEQALRRQAIERDLQLAQQVQLSLLPAGCPVCSGYRFFAYYQTAYEVGGDYYDFVELPNGRLAIIMADVAGKGVSAALLMAKLSGELKYYLSCESPSRAVARMNDSLYEGGAGRFVTLLLAIIDKTSPRITLVNAGHPAPLRRRPSGTVEAVGEGQRGVALGILPSGEWRALETECGPGDMWFAFTDGVTEAINAQGELYGVARLRQQLERTPAPVNETGGLIVADVRRFLGDQAPSDDMCLVGWAYSTAPAQARPAREPARKDLETTGPQPSPLIPGASQRCN